MLKRGYIWLAVILTCAILSAAGRASAQDAAAKATSQPENVSAKLQDESYRLDFAINEIEDGKKINSRLYSMNLTTLKPGEIKIGSRVPIDTNTKEGEFQYLDVGTNISAQIRQSREQNGLVVEADVSSFASPDQNPEGRNSHPIVRQVKMGGSVMLPSSSIWPGSAPCPTSHALIALTLLARGTAPPVTSRISASARVSSSLIRS